MAARFGTCSGDCVDTRAGFVPAEISDTALAALVLAPCGPAVSLSYTAATAPTFSANLSAWSYVAMPGEECIGVVELIDTAEWSSGTATPSLATAAGTIAIGTACRSVADLSTATVVGAIPIDGEATHTVAGLQCGCPSDPQTYDCPDHPQNSASTTPISGSASVGAMSIEIVECAIFRDRCTARAAFCAEHEYDGATIPGASVGTNFGCEAEIADKTELTRGRFWAYIPPDVGPWHEFYYGGNPKPAVPPGMTEIEEQPLAGSAALGCPLWVWGWFLDNAQVLEHVGDPDREEAGCAVVGGETCPQPSGGDAACNSHAQQTITPDAAPDPDGHQAWSFEANMTWQPVP
jgi:hypothetical protein